MAGTRFESRAKENYLVYFPYFDKIKVTLCDYLALCVFMCSATSRNCGAGQPLLDNGTVNTLPWQRIHSQQQNNCWTRCFLCGPRRIISLICDERKISD